MIQTGDTVLLLEDEAIIAFALEDMFVTDGAKAIMAATLKEAEAIVDVGEIDAAVLDVNVHGEKSYGIAARLRSLDIPFVFATGYGDTTHPPEFAGTPTVSKPYTHEQVRSALVEARLALTSALRG